MAKNKINIDKKIRSNKDTLSSKLFILIKNLLSLLFLTFAKIFYKPIQSKESNYLFINTGQIGDLVISSVVFVNEYLFPKESKIYFIIKKKYGDIYKDYSGRINLILWDSEWFKYSLWYRLKFIKRLRELKIYYAINLTAGRGPVSDELVYLCGATKRICFQNKYKHLLKYFQKYFDKHYTQIIDSQSINEFERHIELLTWLLKSNNKQNTVCYISDVRKNRMQNVIDSYKHNSSDKIIIINPISDMNFRDWSLANYKQLTNRLTQKRNIIILIQGNRSQKNIIDNMLANNENKNIKNIAGDFSLTDSIALLKCADIFIGNDSGFSHIAKALKKNLIAVIGRGMYKYFFPYSDNKNQFYLYHEMECFGCEWRCVNEKPFCIENVSVDDVYNTALKLLDL